MRRGEVAAISNEEFEILDYLDIYKVVRESNMKEDLGVNEAILQSLLEKGYAKRVKGTSLQIEPAGEKAVAEHRHLLLDQGGWRDKVLKGWEDFEEVNRRFKALVGRWQMKDANGVKTVNNHSDKEYDSGILGELAKIHEDNKNVINKFTEIIPTYRRYVDRFEAALKRLNSGDTKYMAIARDSYHGVWYELHESILKLSGKERVE